MAAAERTPAGGDDRHGNPSLPEKMDRIGGIDGKDGSVAVCLITGLEMRQRPGPLSGDVETA
jgi:hypothetical protein